LLRVALFALASIALIAASLLTPRAAFAQDRRIEQLAKEAMKRARADFSAADYDGGLARLLKATRACGTIRCSAPTRAALLRDTGVMQVRRGNADKAAQLFAEAVQVDRRVDLPVAYESPDIRSAWSAATDQATATSAPQPVGDFVHSPAAEQTPDTPLPIYVEYSGADAVTSVVAKYQGPGGVWKRVNLVRTGRGFGGLVPCGDVKLGVFRYYLQGFDAGGAPDALAGDPKHPFHVAIRKTLVGPPPSLPGQPPPATCGAGGTAASEPPPAPEPEGPAQCVDDSMCNGGVCTNGHCAEPEHQEEERTSYAHLWIGVSLSADVVVLPGSSNVCQTSSTGMLTNSAGYACTNPDGSDYPGTAAENNGLSAANGGNGGQASGGPVFGDIRVLGSVDYAINPNVLLGARFGAVLQGYTGQAAISANKAFGPSIHGELRGTYLFGKNALTHSGFSPLVLVGLGMAKFDAATTVAVTQAGVPGTLPKTAWVTSGPFFVGAGGGVRYQFSQRIAFNMALKLDFAFGGNGFQPSLSPEVALQYGF
jgi:hypothetical protein